MTKKGPCHFLLGPLPIPGWVMWLREAQGFLEPWPHKHTHTSHMLQLREDRYTKSVFWASSSPDFILYSVFLPTAVMLEPWQACFHSWLFCHFLIWLMRWCSFCQGKFIVTLACSIRNGALKGLQAAEPGGKWAFKCPRHPQQILYSGAEDKIWGC